MLAVMRAYLEVDKRKRAEWASDNFINIRWGWTPGVCVGGGGGVLEASKGHHLKAQAG
jgi:hypothetical protein